MEQFNLDQYQIDKILRLQCKLCSNMGIDSTKEERLLHKERLRRLDAMIEDIDPFFFDSIKEAED